MDDLNNSDHSSLDTFDELDRQTCKDMTYKEASSLGFDLIQPKYDGIWCKIQIEKGFCQIFSRTNQVKHHMHLGLDISGVMLGEYMYGSQWSQDPALKGKVFLFDTLELNGVDFRDRNYAERYTLTKNLAGMTPAKDFLLSSLFKIDDFEYTWMTLVEENDYEGLIFRKSTDGFSSVCGRKKQVVTDDLLVMEFQEEIDIHGQPKETLGALLCVRDSTSELMPIGSGFTKEERQHIWNNQPDFIGKVVEVEGKKRFDSGKLRHPVFKRFRDDKTYEDFK